MPLPRYEVSHLSLHRTSSTPSPTPTAMSSGSSSSRRMASSAWSSILYRALLRFKQIPTVYTEIRTLAIYSLVSSWDFCLVVSWASQTSREVRCLSTALHLLSLCLFVPFIRCVFCLFCLAVSSDAVVRQL